MNSLLKKEGMAGKVQMVYIDPPYGIKYNSNFQPFVNKRDVKDGNDADIPAEPEMIQAFRDTWELGIHSYLTYLRDRLLLARDLHESGSCFVQISDENIHHIREIMDEVFGTKNFVSLITFAKTSGFSSTTLDSVSDYLVWYSKDITKLKYHQLFTDKFIGAQGGTTYNYVLLPDGKKRPLSRKEIANPSSLPEGSKIFALGDLTSSGKASISQEFNFQGKSFIPGPNNH